MGMEKCHLDLEPDVAALADGSELKRFYDKHGCDMKEQLDTFSAALDKYNILAAKYLQYLSDHPELDGDVKMGGDLFDDKKYLYDKTGFTAAITFACGVDGNGGFCRSPGSPAVSVDMQTESDYWAKRASSGGDAASRDASNHVWETYIGPMSTDIASAKVAACALAEIAKEKNHAARVELGALTTGAAKGATLTEAELATINAARAAAGLAHIDADLAARLKDAEGTVMTEAGGDVGIRPQEFSRLVFKEQCFLQTKIVDLVTWKKLQENQPTGQIKKLPYYGGAVSQQNTDPSDTCPPPPGSAAISNASLMIEGDPFNFINFLTQHPAQSAFFNMETKEISSLQPMIRLYKVGVDQQGREFQQEINFAAYFGGPDRGQSGPFVRSVESMLKDKTTRGYGVGIKKFSFTYDGNNPFAAKKSIKAKLQIFANSFNELLVDRGGYKYADLALKTGGGGVKADACDTSESATLSDKAANNLAKLNFRLKAVIGWAQPTGNTSLFTTEANKRHVLDAIKYSFVTLNLTPTIHEFDIDDMGRVNFTINYLAYTDDFFDQAQFNIFYDTNSGRALTERRMLYKSIGKKCEAGQISEIKKADATSGAITSEKTDSMRSLMRRMRSANRINYINLSWEELREWQKAGPFFVPEGGLKIASASSTTETVSPEMKQMYIDNYVTAGGSKDQTSTERTLLNISLEANAPDKAHFSFFYISDLVDTVLEGIEEYLKDYSKGGAVWGEIVDPLIDECEKKNEAAAISRFYENFKKFRVILGPMIIVDPKNPDDTHLISLGDLPISVKYFLQWLNEKLTKKEQSIYNLSRFLSDLFNELIRNFLNDDTCFTFNTKQKIRLNQAVVTSYRDTEYDEVTAQILDTTTTKSPIRVPYAARLLVEDIKKEDALPLLNVSGPANFPVPDTGMQKEMNYLIFSAGRTKPIGKMTGDRIQDEKDGIFHYMLGRPRGILKKISLSKTDAPYLKEVRFEQEGYDGLQQLREVYDVNVECFASVKTFPGTYIFVNPAGWDPTTGGHAGDTLDLTQYGIGGYCMIIRSEHSFGPGEANSTLTAKWVAEIDAKIEADETEAQPDKRPDAGDNQETGPCDELVTRKAAEVTAAEAAGRSTPQADPESTDTVGEAPTAADSFAGLSR